MSIKDILEKIKPFYMLVLSLVSGTILFGLGRLSSISEQKTPISIRYESIVSESASAESALTEKAAVKATSTTASPKQILLLPAPKTSGEVIGSKTGKKYYFPWCGTVKRIKPENQVHFASAELAVKAGFTPGGNCKGLN